MSMHVELARNLLGLMGGCKLTHEDHAACRYWLHEIISGKLMICEWKRDATGQYYIDGLDMPWDDEPPTVERPMIPRTISLVTPRSVQQ